LFSQSTLVVIDATGIRIMNLKEGSNEVMGKLCTYLANKEYRILEEYLDCNLSCQT
jgi:hypothetical protein